MQYEHAWPQVMKCVDVLHDEAVEVAREAGVTRWLVTLSHTDHVAQATVVAL